MIKKNITTAILSLLFLISCNQIHKQENTETIVKETNKKNTDEIITGTLSDSLGNVVTYSFNNTKNTVVLKLKDETFELVRDTMASGVRYSNNQYTYAQWHGITTIKKNGVIIFEADENRISK